MNIIKSSYRIFSNNKIISSFIILNLFLGICIPLALFSYQKFINQSVREKGKELLGADFRVSSRITPRDESIKKIDQYLTQFGLQDKVELLSMFSMAVNEENMSLVQVRYINGNYPFYGVIESNEGLKISDLKSNEVFLSKEASLKLGLGPGEEVKIADSSYIVKDILKKDINQNIQVGSIAPRAYIKIDPESRKEMKLFGKTIFYNYLYKLDKTLSNEDVSVLREKVGDIELRYKSSINANNQVARSIKLVLDFSELIFILGLLISMTSFYYIFRHFLSNESENISIYKFIGLSKVKLLALYSSFCVLCFFIAVGVSFLVQKVVFSYLKLNYSEFVDFDLIQNFPFLLMFLFLIFILTIIFPIILSKINGKSYTLLNVFPILILNFILYLQTNSIVWAPLIVLGLIIVSGLTYFLLPHFFKYFKSNNFLNSLSLKLMLRKKDLLFSKFFMLFVTFLIFNLSPLLLDNVNRYFFTDADQKPDYFLIDIQEDQVKEIKDYLNKNGLTYTEPEPLVRARLIKINGDDITLKESANESLEEKMKRRSLNRGVNLSYKSKLNSSEKVVSGTYQKKISKEDIYSISLEKRYAKRLEVDVGDELTFEIFDLPFKTRVTSIREVKWTSFLPNFLISFPDGVLNDAPKTFVSTLKLNGKSSKDLFEFNKIFPNITMIDISGIVTELSKVFKLISIAIKVMIYTFLSISFVAFCSLVFFHLKIIKQEGDLLNILGLTVDKIRRVRIMSYLYLALPTIFMAIILSYITCFFLMKYLFMSDFYFSYHHLVMNIIVFVVLGFYFSDNAIVNERSKRI